MQFRSTQREIVGEERYREGEPRLASALRIGQKGEVAYSTAVGVSTSNPKMFKLGAIIHLFWSFLAMVREFQEHLKYREENHTCLALVGTRESVLGHFAPDQFDPHFRGSFHTYDQAESEICREENLLVCRENVDLLTLKSKVVPEFIHSMASELARAYNQREAKCFSKETGELPSQLWPRN